MAQTFTIRPYRPGDEEQIVELLEIVFEGWPHFDLGCSPLDHWIWKFKDNPLHMNLIILAEAGGKIIGCDHAFITRIKVGERVLLSRQGVDAAVHPDFRGIGVYSKMKKLKIEMDSKLNLGFVYWATMNPIFKKSFEREDRLEFPHPVIEMNRILDVDLHVKKSATRKAWLKKYGFYALKTLKKIEGVYYGSTSKSRSKFEISGVERFDDRIDAFWQSVKDSYSFVTERSREYLNWRYCDPRGGNYIIKKAEEDEHLVGYIVLRINRYDQDYPKGFIVDLCTLTNRLDCADALIASAIGFFDERKVNITSYRALKGHPHERLFGRYGFLDNRDRIMVGYEPLLLGREQDSFKNTPSNRLLFQHGDIDWI